MPSEIRFVAFANLFLPSLQSTLSLSLPSHVAKKACAAAGLLLLKVGEEGAELSANFIQEV